MTNQTYNVSVAMWATLFVCLLHFVVPQSPVTGLTYNAAYEYFCVLVLGTILGSWLMTRKRYYFWLAIWLTVFKILMMSMK